MGWHHAVLAWVRRRPAPAAGLAILAVLLVLGLVFSNPPTSDDRRRPAVPPPTRVPEPTPSPRPSQTPSPSPSATPTAPVPGPSGSILLPGDGEPSELLVIPPPRGQSRELSGQAGHG